MDITKTDRGYSWTCPICRTHIDVELFGDGSNSKQMAERFKQDHIAARNTFLIDPTGTIRKVYANVNPTPHSKEVLADLPGRKRAWRA